MRVTAIVNLKGGVGKTVTVINMADILSQLHGKRVLVMDADSQCNTTEFFDAFSEGRNMGTLLRAAQTRHGIQTRHGMGKFVKNCIHRTEYENIDVLPASDDLMDLDLSKIQTGIVDASVLREAVEEVSDVYDYVLIDCPPAFNAASAAALIAADDVIIPIKLDAFSLRGMVNLTRQIMNMRQINPRLKIAGILPTMWYNDPEIADAEKQLQDAGLHVFPHIRRSDKVDKMTFRQEPLLISSPRSSAGIDYRKFVKEFVGGK